MLSAICVLGVAALGVWRLTPRRSNVEQSHAVAPPDTLAAHCRDAVGAPRVERIGDRIFAAIGYDLANTILIHTDAGNVVVDVGMSPTRAREAKRALTEASPGKTLAIIYTHSHIDHVGGASEWVEPGTEIWATDAFLDHFVKQYGEFRVAESRRGAAQFGAHVDDVSLPCSAIGRKADVDAASETGMRMPTRTFSGSTSLDIGGVKIELVEAHGETHDQLYVWLPSQNTLLPGDNYYRAFPNLYTIRGTSPRPIDAWIESLDSMRRRQPEHLVPSHTVPIHGRSTILDALTRYRDAIQWVRDRTVQGANAGVPVDTLAETIGLPPSLAHDPALAPMYGQIDWSVRAIYTNHLGWFDGSPEKLYPMSSRDRASHLVAAMGGPEKLWASIESEMSRDPRWSIEQLVLLRDAGLATDEPAGRWALAMGQALRAVAGSVGNTNGRGYLLESSLSLTNGRLPTPTPKGADAILDAVPMRVFFRVMASRLVPELAVGTTECVRFDFDDTHERFFVTLRNGVAEVSSGEALPETPTPIATVKTSASVWRRVATDAISPASAISSGKLTIEGDLTGFYTFSKRFQRGL